LADLNEPKILSRPAKTNSFKKAAENNYLGDYISGYTVGGERPKSKDSQET